MCQGVKESLYKFNTSYDDFEFIMNDSKSRHVIYVKIPYKLAHNIIYAAIEYAEEYGFQPCKDFVSVTGYFLEEDTDAIPLMKIECGGIDGRPKYINTGFDDPVREKQIIAQLEKTAGQGNYDLLLESDGEELMGDYNKIDDFHENPFNFSFEARLKFDEDYIKYANEIKALSKEEQKILYSDLYTFRNLKNIEDTKKLLILSAILSEDIVAEDELKVQLSRFEKIFNIKFVDIDELPNTLVTDEISLDRNKIFELFNDTVDAIINDPKPKKAVTDFKNEVGDAPISDFIELYYYQQRRKRDFDKKLLESYQKHPEYFLFQMHYLSRQQTYEQKKPDAKTFEKLVTENKQKITKFEADVFFYLYSYILTFDESTELSALMAYMKYVNTLDFLSSNTYHSTFSFVKSEIMKRVFYHYEKK